MAAPDPRPAPELPHVLALGSGTSVTVRLARPTDLDAVGRMHRRCSLETIFRRYFTAVPQLSPELQRRLLTSSVALVAEHDGEVVGLAHLVLAPDVSGDSARPHEISLLVEDSWQRRGVGSALADAILEEAQAAGLTQVVAYTLPSSTASHALLRRARSGRAHPEFHHGSDGLVTVTITLRRPTPNAGTTLPTGAASRLTA
jgi:GNAT superfamily N-acetyltransferase